MHIDQPRHHEPAGMIDQPGRPRRGRRRLLGADKDKPAVLVEDQNLACRGSSSAPVNSVPQRTKVFIAAS